MRGIFFVLALLSFGFPASAEDDNDREGGIIGTGIVGTITHLGSIYVNGQHVVFDPTLPVTDAVAPIAAANLRPGHIVAIVAQPEQSSWRAQEIRQIHALVGPIEAIGDGSMTVLGTRVLLDGVQSKFQTGDWVAVSGLWQGQDVRASLLEAVPASQKQARVNGTYFETDAQGRDVIGGSVIIGLKTEHLNPGSLVRVFGQPTSGGIIAKRLETHLFDKPVGVTQVEGYFSKPRPDGLYTVIGSGLISYTEQPEMIDLDRKQILCWEGGRLADSANDASPVQQQLGCGS